MAGLARVPKRLFSDSFLNPSNANYIDQMYDFWRKDPHSVHASWQAYFAALERGAEPGAVVSAVPAAGARAVPGENLERLIGEMVTDFRNLGHYRAQIDPLELGYGKLKASRTVDFSDVSRVRIPQGQLDTRIRYQPGGEGFHTQKADWTAREIFELLNKIYCGKIGYQYTHISDKPTLEWIRKRIEHFPPVSLAPDQKRKLLDDILESQAFSIYCEKKFSTYKRFGCEGLDASISGMVRLVEVAKDLGVQHVTMGMAHRGRLNMLCSVLRKPHDQMFAEFEDVKLKSEKDIIFGFSGDVKYHIGSSNKLSFADGKTVTVHLLPNPSHLEAVNALVLGQTLAIQREIDDETGERALPVIIHGDAAITGQGINYELQQMELLRNYCVGGAIHVVFNNQIGFTTDPKDGRSSFYASNIAKLNNNFVIHVNAHEPELVNHAFEVAIEFRQKFHRDVYIDLVGYRKFGHNEQDQPSFTQPHYYAQMEKIKPMYLDYSAKLVAENVVPANYVQERLAQHEKQLTAAHEKAKKGGFDVKEWDFYDWNQAVLKSVGETRISEQDFKTLGKIVSTLPADKHVHPTIAKLYAGRLKSIETGTEVEWATAEALAMASLVNEGRAVRFSGEDAERGTFSNRHAVVVDQKTNEKICPLADFARAKNVDFTIFNTLLSEYATMGFELGHSWAFPNSLTVWEAQFGDFMNGAQIIIDQFLMNGEKKWGKMSSLVLLLPHGYDGQGPEHSNARLERHLANLNDDFLLLRRDRAGRALLEERCNVRVCNLTSAANFFHALRGQVKNKYRKPLIVMSPKKLLRDKSVKSSMEEFTQGRFVKIYDDRECPDKTKAQAVFLCSGQIYFDLLAHREQHKLTSRVAIVRFEQLGPFPYNEFEQIITQYNKRARVVWVSEEPLNFSAFPYVQNRANLVLSEHGFHPIEYAGRAASAASSGGKLSAHKREQAQVITDAFDFLSAK